MKPNSECLLSQASSEARSYGSNLRRNGLCALQVFHSTQKIARAIEPTIKLHHTNRIKICTKTLRNYLQVAVSQDGASQLIWRRSGKCFQKHRIFLITRRLWKS